MLVDRSGYCSCNTRLVLIINKVEDGCLALAVVHLVSEAWRVDDGELDRELELSSDDVNFGEFADMFDVTVMAVALRGRRTREFGYKISVCYIICLCSGIFGEFGGTY
jgi:hypothetical protein